MKIKSLIQIGALLIIIFLGACNNQKDKKILLTNITGELNEVLVVMDNGTLKSPANKLLKNMLQQDVPALPQDEPMFNVVDIQRNGFTNIFQLYRNILDVHISSENKKNKIWFGKDVFAKTQTYIKIEAIDYKGLNTLIKQYGDKIIKLFREAEIKRLQRSYKNRFSVGIMKRLKEKYDIKIDIPANYKLDIDTSNFMWISFETPYLSQGIFIYSMPYQDTVQFSKSYLLQQTDSITKQYISAPAKGSYMTTEYDFPIDYQSSIDTSGFYSVVIRRLWETEGDFMGGPSVDYYFPNKEKDKIIAVCSYVYCPKKDKRNYMMQLEAIIKTATYND